jgi:hypothetical protein
LPDFCRVVLALAIALGSVVGRYHYAADALSGAALAILGFLISRWCSSSSSQNRIRTPARNGIDQRELSLLTSRRPSSTSQSTSDSPPMNLKLGLGHQLDRANADQEAAGRTEAERPRLLEELAILARPGPV